MEKSFSSSGINGTFSGTININLSANTVTSYIEGKVFKEYIMEDEHEVYRKILIIEYVLVDRLKVLADGPPEEPKISDKLRDKGYN